MILQAGQKRTFKSCIQRRRPVRYSEYIIDIDLHEVIYNRAHRLKQKFPFMFISIIEYIDNKMTQHGTWENKNNTQASGGITSCTMMMMVNGEFLTIRRVQCSLASSHYYLEHLLWYGRACVVVVACCGDELATNC